MVGCKLNAVSTASSVHQLGVREPMRMRLHQQHLLSLATDSTEKNEERERERKSQHRKRLVFAAGDRHTLWVNHWPAIEATTEITRHQWLLKNVKFGRKEGEREINGITINLC